MLNSIWPIFIIISIIYSILCGNLDLLNNSIFDSISNTIKICIELLGTICFWNGIMKIATKTKFINLITNLLKPINKFLFPKLKRKSLAYKNVTMNIISNMLGLGNAATPLGINAMKELQNENDNKKQLSNEMKMFILINTASIQIIPTTVIAIRTSFGSTNPTKIIVPVWIASIVAFISVVTVMKLLIKIKGEK